MTHLSPATRRIQLAKQENTFIFSDGPDEALSRITNGHLVDTKCGDAHDSKGLCCKTEAQVAGYAAAQRARQPWMVSTVLPWPSKSIGLYLVPDTAPVMPIFAPHVAGATQHVPRSWALNEAKVCMLFLPSCITRSHDSFLDGS